MRRGKTRAQDLLVAERRAYVYRLKEAGASYAQIVATIRMDAAWSGRLSLSYGTRDAHRDVTVELERYQDELKTLVELERTKELLRLDRLQMAIWQRAVGTASMPADLGAMDRVLAIMDRRRRLIPGLEAPQKIAPTNPAGDKPYDPNAFVTDEVAAEVAALLAQYGQVAAETLHNEVGQNGHSAPSAPWGNGTAHPPA